MALTDVYGANHRLAFVSNPPKKIRQGEYGGRVRVIREKFTFDADGGATETVKVGRLPKGAMVLGARVFGPDLGGTGTSELGYSGNVDGGSDETRDEDGFIDAIDHSGQVFDVVDSASAQRGPAVGIKRFAAEVDIEWKLTGATSGATGKIVYFEVFYILD